MTGFRLTPDAAGCPPLETPPAGYKNPFRVDENDALWIRQCFVGFKYFGAARHDVSVWPPPIIGGASAPVTPWGGEAVANLSNGVKAGRYKNIEVFNELPCDIGLLFGLDLVADLIVRADNRVYMTVQSRFNGLHHSSTDASTPQFPDSTKHVRRQITISANPHDAGFERDSVNGPTLIVPSGEGAVVSAKLHIRYGDSDIPSGTEHIIRSVSAVRVYGYIL